MSRDDIIKIIISSQPTAKQEKSIYVSSLGIRLAKGWEWNIRRVNSCSTENLVKTFKRLRDEPWGRKKKKSEGKEVLDTIEHN